MQLIFLYENVLYQLQKIQKLDYWLKNDRLGNIIVKYIFKYAHLFS